MCNYKGLLCFIMRYSFFFGKTLALDSHITNGGFMKLSIFFSVLLAASMAFSATAQNSAPKSYSFQFKASKSKPFSITQTASSKDQAFKLAAAECFKKLTANKYPGEEKGLEIIDICVNPKM